MKSDTKMQIGSSPPYAGFIFAEVQPNRQAIKAISMIAQRFVEEAKMRLEGSCHCRAVRFSLESTHPYPFNLCYCSICRKTAGAGGFAINLSGDYNTLRIDGRNSINFYQALIRDSDGAPTRQSRAQRYFCRICASALWLRDPNWPDLVHPHASAIDTELPIPPERTHFMLEFKPAWVEVCARPRDKQFAGYPDESIAQWHERLKLADKPRND